MLVDAFSDFQAIMLGELYASRAVTVKNNFKPYKNFTLLLGNRTRTYWNY